MHPDFYPCIRYQRSYSRPLLYLLCSCMVIIQSCQSKAKRESGIFKLLDADQTHITFSNNVAETDSLNILDYLYFYNGGGIASADFNNDGLEDLYFISNQESNRLYLNKGDLKFKDISEGSGAAGSGNWKTGVTVVDINNDGYKDIYVSVVSGYKSFKGKNQLYINNGNLTFSEKAADYGLDFAGLSTQASFFDYDKDGDLDMYLLTHSVHSNESYGDSTLRFKYSETAGDHLFRNNNNHFRDVTRGAGIYASPIGYGLGLSVADFNNDGWDDIYVSNDFFEQDYYYINQKDGTFKEKLKDAFGHTSLFSMGNAAGDINKDGYLDLVSTDMLPADIKALKSTINDQPLDIYNLEVKSGFYYQNSRNSLQLNVGRGKKFVDVGLYAGVAATDWTWSPLVQDFDMDGYKDLFFSNGIKKRLNDLDYLKYLGNPGMADGLNNDRKFDRSKIEKMPDGRVANFLFRGDSALKFTDVSGSNDMLPSSSSGAIYVDLDNDGDMEIVTNNMDEPASVYRNTKMETAAADKPVFLSYSVKYTGMNRDGIGTRLFMRSESGKVDHQEIQTSTAFQSNQNSNLLFTFSSDDKPARLLIVWPDNSYQVMDKFTAGEKKELAWGEIFIQEPVADIQQVIEGFLPGNSAVTQQEMDAKLVVQLRISRTPDFNYYSLLPHTYLKHTPPVAVADINNDGFDDLYVGGIAGEEKYLLMGSATGFKKVSVDAFHSSLDIADAEAQWSDLDNDGDQDLLVTNSEHPLARPPLLQPHRIFLNSGKLIFEALKLPALNTLTSKVAVIDYNGDGLKDLFLAGAVNFRDYTSASPSFLLLNAGKGSFIKASLGSNQDLSGIRFIKDMTVIDLNSDGKDDLVIAAEWQPLQVFLNDGKSLRKQRLPLLENRKGWWQSATIADLDQDGKADLLAGNWGLNNKYNVTEGPLHAYNNDLDKDGKADLIISYFYKGNHYPFRPKNDLEQELPYLKKEWLSYQKMADRTTTEIFKDRINIAGRLEANTFESIYISDILKEGRTEALPFLYQQAPIISTARSDQPDEIILNANFWGTIPYEGKYDALGLVTMKFSRQSKRFLQPRYWSNPEFNFNEVSFIARIKGHDQSQWVILTSEGKLLSVTESDKGEILANQ